MAQTFVPGEPPTPPVDGNNILAESGGEGDTADEEPYDFAADVAEDFGGGGKKVLIAVITRPELADEDKLHAYLDDSAKTEAGIVCSAGYLFEPSGAREFRKNWKPFLESKNMPFFHAKDDIRRPDAEEIFSTLARLTKATAFRGLVNYLKPSALESFEKKGIRRFVGSAFSISTLGCMLLMAKVAKEQKKLIVYFIEDGNPFAGELRHFLNQIKLDSRQMENYAMAMADTVNKRDVIQLQAADLFAWSSTRSYHRGGWVPQIADLVQDGTLRHTMSAFDPQMLAMLNSGYGMQSNRRKF